MAFEQGIATSKEDFVNKLTTFAGNNGWTIDEFSAANDVATIHINNVFVHFRWDASATGGITCFHSLGFRQEAVSAVVTAGGTGYNDGSSDVLTVVGGTFTTAATFTATVSGGIVTSVALLAAGNYSVIPANPAATTVVPSGGTGCTLTVTYKGLAGENQTDGSGNGDDSGAIDSERRMNDTGNGPYINHWFFTSNEGGADYLYAVLEHSAGIFKSFGAGEMVKFGTWTGGEFCGMTKTEGSFIVNDSRHNYIVDGRINTNSEAATIHCEGLPGQTASKWAVCMQSSATPGLDDASNTRNIFGGGARQGWLQGALQGMRANPNNGFIPMIPYLLWYRTNSGNDWRFMGRLPHIRELNGFSLIAAEEFTIGGSETWKVFPQARKASSGTPTSGNAFVAFRKIV